MIIYSNVVATRTLFELYHATHIIPLVSDMDRFEIALVPPPLFPMWFIVANP
jgi:hypothetical protein